MNLQNLRIALLRISLAAVLTLIAHWGLITLVAS